MKHKCAICGRQTEPYAYIGQEVIGPKCAKKIGLTASVKLPKSSAVRFSRRAIKPAEIFPETMDLFADLEKSEV